MSIMDSQPQSTNVMTVLLQPHDPRTLKKVHLVIVNSKGDPAVAGFLIGIPSAS